MDVGETICGRDDYLFGSGKSGVNRFLDEHATALKESERRDGQEWFFYKAPQKSRPGRNREA